MLSPLLLSLWRSVINIHKVPTLSIRTPIRARSSMHRAAEAVFEQSTLSTPIISTYVPHRSLILVLVLDNPFPRVTRVGR